MGTILMREWIEARRRILCYGSWTPGCAADLIVPGISGTREEICSVIAFPGSGRTVTDPDWICPAQTLTLSALGRIGWL